MAFTIEDVNSRTLLQQFHSLYKRQQETDENVSELSTDLNQEIQNRSNADAELADDIADLQRQLDSLGNIFTLKGSVATVADLPATDNNIGDVYYVVSGSVGYVWIDDNGTERWEQLGISVDLSNYVTQSDLSTALSTKQNSLIAGTNISIIGDTISAQQPNTAKFEMLSGASAPTTSTVGAVGQKYLDTTKNDIYVCTEIINMGSDVYTYTWLLAGGNGKQDKLTAGTNITITGDVISASGGNTTYMHLITIRWGGTQIIGYTSIITDNNTPFTTTTFAEYIYSKGITSAHNFPFFGVRGSGNTMHYYDALYANGQYLYAHDDYYTYSLDGTNVVITGTSTSASVEVYEDFVIPTTSVINANNGGGDSN